METTPERHDVYVLEVDGVFKVRPAVVIVRGGPGAQLKIRNLTKYDVELDFPDKFLEVGKPLRQRAEKRSSPPSGPFGPDKLTLPLDANADGDYPYRVTVLTGGGVPAVGESGPIIIVDR